MLELVGLEVHFDLFQFLLGEGMHFSEFPAHGSPLLLLALEGSVLPVALLGEDEVAGEILGVLGGWLADEVVPVGGGEVVVLGDVLVFVLSLPLPLDVQWVLRGWLPLHQLVLGELGLPCQRQRAVLLLPLPLRVAGKRLYNFVLAVVGVELVDSVGLVVGLSRHEVALALLVYSPHAASEVVGQFLLVDLHLRPGWLPLLGRLVVVGEGLLVVNSYMVVVPGDFLDGA